VFWFGCQGPQAQYKVKAKWSMRSKSTPKDVYLQCRWFLNIPVDEENTIMYIFSHPWSDRGV
jgi:hypothetical protein